MARIQVAISFEELTNNLLRKSPTSFVVDGPPMFMKTIAVGPFEPVASCVTGGARVSAAKLFLCCHCGEQEVTANLEIGLKVARSKSWRRGCRRAILLVPRKFGR
jgi:hypothetical protein